MDAGDIIKRYQKLKSARTVYDQLYQEVADYFLPFKADFNRLYSPGEKRNRELYTQLPQHAVDITSSSLIGLIANPASRWFYLEMLDEKLNRDSVVADWCENAGQTLINYVTHPSAQFYSSLKSALEDALVFGTPSMYVNEHNESKIVFGSKTVHSFCIAENSDGVVDTVFNETEMTARQIMQEVENSGWTSHKDLEKLAMDKPDETLDVIHAILPRKESKEGTENPKNMPIAGYYVDKKHKKILHETGYQEFPQPVARWRKTVNEVYGRSQAMIALADTQTLNVAMRMFMLAVEKQVQPNIFLPNDSSPSNVDLTAGGVTYYDATKGRPEFHAGTGDLGTVFTFMQDLENRINSTMYVDQLQLVGNADMTATEVLQRQNEKARLLAPALGRFQSELLTPLLSRALRIGIREGWIEFPVEVAKKIGSVDFNIAYTTPITRAQRDQDMNNIMMALEAIGGVAGIDPGVMKLVDTSKVVDEIMDIRGVTGFMKRDEIEVEEMEKAEAEALEAANTMGALQQGANIAKTANDAGLLEEAQGAI
jgi:hypothetical protein